MTFHPPASRGHHCIIVAINYFTKWVDSMPTFSRNGETIALFIFNQVITRYDVLEEIFIAHVSHFLNKIMLELALKLGFR